MKLVPISTKVSEALFAELQRESETKKLSVSELLRRKLTRDNGDDLPGVAALAAQVKELAQQVKSQATAVKHLASVRENDPPIGAMIEALSENISRLVDLLTEEKLNPFGMRREFFQVATMAGFALARGSFTHDPQAWEPFKEEARRRASPKREDER